jgi:hypothetical protein
MSAADQTIYEISHETLGGNSPFISKKFCYIQDLNNGVYNSNQFQLDSSSFSNSGALVDYGNAFLTIPLVLTWENSTNASGVAAFTGLVQPFLVGLKNGHFHIINSLTISYNNTTVANMQVNSDFYVNYQLMTTMSQDSLNKWGDIIGFYPDNALSHVYDPCTLASQYGHGSINNNTSGSDYTTLLGVNNLWCQNTANTTIGNQGFYRRQLTTSTLTTSPANVQTSYQLGAAAASSITVSQGVSNGDNGNPLTYSNNLTQTGESYYYHVAGSNQYYWYVTAIVYLKHTHDFFRSLGLVKGAFIKIIANLNQSSQVIALTTAGGAVSDLSCTSSTCQGSASIVKINNTALANVRAAAITTGNATYSFNLRCAVGKDVVTGQANPWSSSIRLYANLYTLSPEKDNEYFSSMPTRMVVYDDIYTYILNYTTANGVATMSNLITNGVTRPRYLILLPFIGQSSNYLSYATGAAANPTLPYQSPFASEPGTCSPYIFFSNMNIQVAGVNIYTSNAQYTFDNYTQEISELGLNGGISEIMSSGLVSYLQYKTNFGPFVVNISRRLNSEQDIPKSISINGNIYCSFNNVQIVAIVVYERAVLLQTDSGALIET